MSNRFLFLQPPIPCFAFHSLKLEMFATGLGETHHCQRRGIFRTIVPSSSRWAAPQSFQIKSGGNKCQQQSFSDSVPNRVRPNKMEWI